MASDHRGEVLVELKDFGRSNITGEADCDFKVHHLADTIRG